MTQEHHDPFCGLDYFQKYSLVRRSDVTLHQRTVLLTLFAYAGNDTGTCYPSIKRIAFESLISESSAKRAIDKLCASGILVKTPQYRNKARYNNLYKINFDRLPVLPQHPRTHSEPTPPIAVNPPPVQPEPTPQFSLNPPPGHGEPLTNPVKLNKLTNLSNFSNACACESEKSADAENLKPSFRTNIPNEFASESTACGLNALEHPLNSSNGETCQTAREDGLQALLEENQLTKHPSLVVDPDPVDGKEGSAAQRSMVDDKVYHKPAPWGSGHDRRQSNRDRAQSGAWLQTGIRNKRWKDKADFDKFSAYVEGYAEKRRKDPELNQDGSKYGREYVASILSRTANTQDDNDPALGIWKQWNLEPAPAVYIEPKEDRQIVETSPEILAKFEAFKARAAKERAEREAKELERKARLSGGWGECA